MSANMGKVSIVTGASRGIGRAIALRLSRDGFAVVVNFAGDAAAADTVVADIAANGGNAIACRADISDPVAVAAMFAKASETFGPVTTIVQNAGIMALSPIADTELETFDRMIATNLRGAFVVFSEAARQVADGGRIIALSSSVIAKAFPNYGPYIASKAGVEGLVHVLANELRGRNICVNTVAPGPVGTELFLEGKSSDDVTRLSKMSPLERLGRPEDIANVVAFLASADGGWINGQVLRANGGFA